MFFHVAAVIWVIVWVLIYSYVPHPLMDSASIIYTKIHIKTYAAQIMFLPPVLIVFASSIFNIFLNRSTRYLISYFIAPILATVGFFVIALFGLPSNPYALGAEVYGLPDPETGEPIYTPRIEHLQSIAIHGRVYNFLRYEKRTMNLTLPIHTYHLYECDSLGISCNVVYRHSPLEEGGMYHIYDDLENKPYFEVKDSQLHVFIAGEQVYSQAIGS